MFQDSQIYQNHISQDKTKKHVGVSINNVSNMLIKRKQFMSITVSQKRKKNKCFSTVRKKKALLSATVLYFCSKQF